MGWRLSSRDASVVWEGRATESEDASGQRACHPRREGAGRGGRPSFYLREQESACVTLALSPTLSLLGPSFVVRPCAMDDPIASRFRCSSLSRPSPPMLTSRFSPQLRSARDALLDDSAFRRLVARLPPADDVVLDPAFSLIVPVGLEGVCHFVQSLPPGTESRLPVAVPLPG